MSQRSQCLAHEWSSTLPIEVREVQHELREDALSTTIQCDFITFLAVAQYYEVDFVSLAWEEDKGSVAVGGTSQIYQANVSLKTNFIFKRTTLVDTSRSDSQKEEKAFNALISEIAVLCHPKLRVHQNIVNLEGICWEVPQGSDKVWPVLVLEKAPLGDLKTFVASERARSTNLDERLELCVDIASAIIALHENSKVGPVQSGTNFSLSQADMSHGDIKPANVLIFQDKLGGLYAKLADFGYAGWTFGPQKDRLVKPPKSWPWDPPEYHHRGFTVSAAQRLDMYSFGMLCLWLLFHDKSHEAPSAYRNQYGGSTWPLKDYKQLDSMKHCDTLSEFAGLIVGSLTILPDVQKENLRRFFSLTLAREPSYRNVGFEDLTLLLGHGWLPGPVSVNVDKTQFEHVWTFFEIAKSFQPLMLAHHRVRKYIFKCMEHRARNDSSKTQRYHAMFQTAFCYRTGFGVPSNDDVSSAWLEESQKSVQDLANQLSLARATSTTAYQNGELLSLGSSGYMEVSTGYMRGQLPRVDDECMQEIQDMERVLGKYCACVLALKIRRANLLQITRRYKYAEDFLMELLWDLRDDPGYLNRAISDVERRFIGGPMERRMGLWSSLEEISSGLQIDMANGAEFNQRPTILNDILGCLDEAKRDTEEVIISIGLIYRAQNRWSDAAAVFLRVTYARMERLRQDSPRTLFSASYLAEACYKMGKWSTGINIYQTILGMQVERFGANDHRTIKTKANLAMVYGLEGSPEKGETLLLEVIEAQQRSFGKGNQATCKSLSILADFYWAQRRLDESGELFLRVISIRKRDLGPEHLTTLDAMDDLARVFIHQGRWLEAQGALRQVLKRWQEAFGSNHSDVLDTREKLAVVEAALGNFQESETGFREVIEGWKKRAGEDHTNYFVTDENLAALKLIRGHAVEAEKMLKKVLEKSRKAGRGNQDPRTIRTMAYLAQAYSAQARLEDAEQLFLQVVQLGKNSLGEKDPEQLQSERKLIEIYFRRGCFEEGEQMAQHILEKDRRSFDCDPVDMIDDIIQLARIQSARCRWQEANANFTEVIDRIKRTLGYEKTPLPYATWLYANCLWRQGRWLEAVAGLYRYSTDMHAIRALSKGLRCRFGRILTLPGMFAATTRLREISRNCVTKGLDLWKACN
ncbi:MAG: hypothetical protein Q9172_006438 [Xanthocarpia lactea]